MTMSSKVSKLRLTIKVIEEQYFHIYPVFEETRKSSIESLYIESTIFCKKCKRTCDIQHFCWPKQTEDIFIIELT